MEERDEQCVVSTIVDGIDNGAVEDVFVYRASYSLFRLIQSLGRIHPGRQNYDYNYATLHIFDTGYDPSRKGDLERRLNDIKVKKWCPTVQMIQQWKHSIEICSIYKDIKTSSIVTINATESYYSYAAEYHQKIAKCAPTV